MARDLKFRSLQEDDKEDLYQLFSEVFEVDKDPAYWDWKYSQNPAGKRIITVALHKNKIVGAMAFIPVRLRVGSNVLLSAQGIDVAVLPKYRGRGTFLKMSRAALEDCAKGNVSLSYAFTIKLTFSFATKFLGFDAICPIVNMAKVLNPTPYLRQKIRVESLTNVFGSIGKKAIKIANKKNFSVPQELKIHEVTHFDHRFDDFWHLKDAKNCQIAVVRDGQYLNWRYINNPTPYKIFSVQRDGAIKGFIVLNCSQEEIKRGRIIDILVDSDQETITDLLITKAINYFLDQEVDVITCWMLEHSPIFQALQKRGFVKRETPHDLIVRSYVTDLPNKHLADRSKWYITMGDSDYF